MKTTEKNILIAYIPNRRDLAIAQRYHWYRIPVSSKNIPKNVKNKTLKLIAFYQPTIFGNDAFAVRFYGIVKNIKIVKRKKLLKDEPQNEKSENDYYKIQFEKLLRLPKPIYSFRRRRILFISTTLERFQNASEINDLFCESPLEEKFWVEFKINEITAERQFLESIGKLNFYLDFALFCKNRKVDIECDGDKYHTTKNDVQLDKRRDNLLESQGWQVFRYTTEDILYKFKESFGQVRDVINNYGGLEDPVDKSKCKYLFDNENEGGLFS